MVQGTWANNTGAFMMKNLLVAGILCLSRPCFAEEQKYAAPVVPLSADNAYFRRLDVPARDFWALSGFYVPQFNDYSCSAASVAMALNALLNTGRQRGDEENILRNSFLNGSTALTGKAF